MSWDARFFRIGNDSLPTEQEMIDKGVITLKDEFGKFYYVEYDEFYEEGQNNFKKKKSKSGFYINMSKTHWYGTVSYANRVQYFGKWLWDNFKVFYADDTDLETTFTEDNLGKDFSEVWKQMTEEEKTMVSNYDTYHQVLYNGVADENDDTLKSIYVEDEQILEIANKYNI